MEESIAQLKEEKANKERLCKLEMEMEQNNIYQKEMKAIIERLCYPVVLRDVIMKDTFEVLKGTSGKIASQLPIVRYEMCWRSIHFSFLIKYGDKKCLSFWIEINSNKEISPLIKGSFEGRFKLTIIDNRFPSDSLVYELTIVKLQPETTVEKFKETSAQQEIKLTEITKELFSEERFKTEKKEI